MDKYTYDSVIAACDAGKHILHSGLLKSMRSWSPEDIRKLYDWTEEACPAEEPMHSDDDDEEETNWHALERSVRMYTVERFSDLLVPNLNAFNHDQFECAMKILLAEFEEVEVIPNTIMELKCFTRKNTYRKLLEFVRENM